LIDLNDFESGEDIASFLKGTFVKISFRMQIGDLVDSTIMQIYPIDFAKGLYDAFMNNQLGIGDAAQEPAAIPEPAPTPAPAPAPAPMPAEQPMMQQAPPQMDMSQMGMSQMGMPQMGMPQMGMPQMAMPQMGMPQMNMQSMNIQPAQFQNFSADYSGILSNENIGLIMDVPLEVTVELGRTSKSISEILEFAPGTIIELDKIAGEPIDVLVNGKFVAKGEVVVIEESFGIRVTEIIK